MFIVGDKVECIKVYMSSRLTIGEIYMVYDINCMEDICICSVIDNEGVATWYNQNMFKIDIKYLRNKKINKLFKNIRL